MELTPLLRKLCRGRHGGESLNHQEASAALSRLLMEDADQLQLGAFLVALRIKGETAAELAGFVDAIRNTTTDFDSISSPDAVDLPCYAGKRRAAPLHLLAAMRARDCGTPVLIHGLSRVKGRLTACDALQIAGVPRASSLPEAAAMLQADGIAYLDVTDYSPPLARLLELRARLGVRSFAHTVARLINPLQCSGQLNGIFHAPYGERMAEVNRQLGQPRSLLFMGAEGEPELYADRQKLLLAQIGGRESVTLHYSGANLPHYPQTPTTPNELLTRWQQLLAGEIDSREEVVLQRMAEAFDFAAGGISLPFQVTLNSTAAPCH
ncbi:MAG: anthranilate phosphoribosyltransferase [Mariprofundales bacterium]|nr:anthranilate phosphoribosyltransferase [Mariprofundales bacterium]